MSKDLTNLYSPNCGQTLKLSMVEDSIKGRPRRLDKSNWSLTQLVIPVGLANCSTSNELYMKIIKDFDLISKTNEEIFKEYVESLSPPTDTMNKGPDNVKLLTLTQQEKIWNSKISSRTRNAIIYLRSCKNWSLKSLSAKFGLWSDDIKRWFYLYK